MSGKAQGMIRANMAAPKAGQRRFCQGRKVSAPAVDSARATRFDRGDRMRKRAAMAKSADRKAATRPTAPVPKPEKTRSPARAAEIGRAHVCTPVTNAQIVSRLLL